MDQTRPKTCSACGTIGCQAKSSYCIKAQAQDMMHVLLKSGTITGTIAYEFTIDGTPVKGSFPITEYVLSECVDQMTTNERDRVMFEAASATQRKSKKRCAGELELEELEKQLERKRHQEDIELHTRREAIKKRAIFGDDEPQEPAPASSGASAVSAANRSWFSFGHS